jgi:hypothetical protein
VGQTTLQMVHGGPEMGYGTLRARLTTLQAVSDERGEGSGESGDAEGHLAAVEDYLAARSRRIVGQIGADWARKRLEMNRDDATNATDW